MNSPETNLPKPEPAQGEQDAGKDTAATETPVRRSAMKLPATAIRPGSQGPQIRRPWENGGNGKARTDAERRAGKSRKVH